MVTKQTNWAKFKEYIIDRGLSIQYIDDYTDLYELYAIDGGFIVLCIVPKTNPRNADQIEAEDNYLVQGNNSRNIVVGATNNTKIGNVGDSLKVSTNITGISTGALSQYPNKLRQLDINVANGGVARGTTITNSDWADIYSYSGSGSMMSFFLNLEMNSDWLIRLVIDGEDVFGSNGVLSSDFMATSVYNVSGNETDALINSLGFYFKSNGNFVWTSPLATPTRYNSSVVIKLKRNTGALSKKFQAGMVTLTKET